LNKSLHKVVIKIAGDSGDGMQLTGAQFTQNTALMGNDLSTFPDFPAEIRAPQGTLAGVSGFQIHFGSVEIDTPGDSYDVLVAMNAAALKANIKGLKKDGILIADSSGFDSKNLKLSGYESSPLDTISEEFQNTYIIDITRQTIESVASLEIDAKEKDRAKNMFVLGLLNWLYNRDNEATVAFIKDKFFKKPIIAQANEMALKAGYLFGDIVEIFPTRYEILPAEMSKGIYRNISGNEALALGLVAASSLFDKPIFFASYPITPASDILHELAKHQLDAIKVVQAEDEISAATMAIGAAFGGSLAITSTSGPGMDLKAEAIGLAMSMEIPLVILDVQRAGPSTGMPTKTEQSDLMMAMYGRHGECPLPIIAANSPADCFDAAIRACEYALNYNTPVILLSDGFIGNSAEPWLLPDLETIIVNTSFIETNQQKLFQRNANHVQPFVAFGSEGNEYRIGGLEKDFNTGNISYNSDNHEKMVKTREAKVNAIAAMYEPLKIESGVENNEIAIVGWGSSKGALKSACKELVALNKNIAHYHIRNMFPLHPALGETLKQYKKVIVAEKNNGQLIKILREKYLIDCIPLLKIQGVPFMVEEVVEFVKGV
jgi:2-oxoglutarate/2-oxoacid ferredoxin oxidoreductase subunit alpha